ncbi:hypothetical protein N7517_000352 [Penicillium concentricum]|uniref:Uncharacterized protein n=1 Tax=Penicillium concentricum TaxID=293559 RepID=A0A9W9SPU7_9EURO|nr:uncharacterized protein N7517_000352 [Penicillium concentricum]KAJ5382441.1 hypothetical protein N7517_000352 [Penicillium concentricum]
MFVGGGDELVNEFFSSEDVLHYQESKLVVIASKPTISQSNTMIFWMDWLGFGRPSHGATT